jgi:hypothetical protein
VRNNLIYGGFAGALHQQYEHYDAATAKWTVENNIASTRSWQLGHGTRVDPSNIFVDEAISRGTLPSNFWDAHAFVNPDYTEPNSKFCGPQGSDNCDWTPKQGSILCTAGSDSGYVGAVPCNGTGVEVFRKLFDKLQLEPKIGPNPFTDHLSIRPVKEISLFTSEGKLVGTYNDPVVFTGNLRVGVYLVKVGNVVQIIVKTE